MKLIKKLSPVALATTMALGALAAPGIASAEMSASASVASFYLWRGQDISAGAPQVSGSLDYSHESGAYAGIWASSEEGGTETDLYVGFAGEMGGFSYDLSIWEYLYPSDNALTGPGDSYSDSDLSEFVLGLGYADVGLTIYFGNDAGHDGTTGLPNSDYEYITLDYTFGDFNILYGTWQYDEAGADESSHLTLSYAVTDNFTFTVSKGMQDTDASVYDEDFLFHVAYSLPIDMK